MPVTFFEKNTGLGELARALTAAPATFAEGRRQGQQQALDRANDAASLRKSIADARKTELETQSLADQRGFQAGLPEDLNILDARRTGRNLPVAPPPVGSAGSPLEFDINQSLRGNQDLFASRDVPSARQSSEALANLLRSFDGNAAQVTDALGNVQSQDLSAEAAGVARENLVGRELLAALNSIQADDPVQAPFRTNASGVTTNQFSGAIDESGQLAGANIDAERALADQRRTSETSLTSQEKQFRALQELNEALIGAGKQPIDEVTMRAIAAGTIETFRDPLGLRTMVFDTARQQVIGTIDEQNGFQPFVPPTAQPETNEPGLVGQALNFLGFGGDESAQAAPEAQVTETPPAAAAPAGQSLFSPVLNRNVTQAEIEATARSRGLTVEQVKQRLGIQ